MRGGVRRCFASGRTVSSTPHRLASGILVDGLLMKLRRRRWSLVFIRANCASRVRVKQGDLSIKLRQQFTPHLSHSLSADSNVPPSQPTSRIVSQRIFWPALCPHNRIRLRVETLPFASPPVNNILWPSCLTYTTTNTHSIRILTRPPKRNNLDYQLQSKTPDPTNQQT